MPICVPLSEVRHLCSRTLPGRVDDGLLRMQSLVT